MTAIAGAAIRLETGVDGRLELVTADERQAVTVRRCFPWSAPARHIVLLNEEEEEAAFVNDPSRLDATSRVALERALADAGFVLTVTRLRSVDEEVEIRHWQVETVHGPRSFQTRLDDWPRTLPNGSVLIRDVAGDLYLIPGEAKLDPHSARLLWAFVD